MSTSTPTSVRAALALGASMRLTRFVVTDDLPGRWWIKEPLDRRIHDHLVSIGFGPDHLGNLEADRTYKMTAHGKVVESTHEEKPDLPWWLRYRDGLDCPFCVGQWIAGAVVVSERLTRHTRFAGAWTLVASALTLNEVAAHLGSRLGDTSED